MNIIKLNAIDSTNSYLVKLSKTAVLDDYTVVLTNHQTKGRGQQGAVWQSAANKSLSFSVFKAFDSLSITKVSSLAFAVSLGLVKALEKEEMELVHGALNFDDTVIRSVMTPRTKMFTLNAKMLLFEALPQINQSAHSRIPIFGDTRDDIVGFIHVRLTQNQAQTLASAQPVCKQYEP